MLPRGYKGENSDDELLKAIRSRIKSQIESLGVPATPAAINNYIGSQGSQGSQGGVLAAMSEPDDSDYYVDIGRRDVDFDIDPKTGKKIPVKGWDKTVHRYKTAKGQEPPEKKKG